VQPAGSGGRAVDQRRLARTDEAARLGRDQKGGAWISGTTRPAALTQTPGGSNLSPLLNFLHGKGETPGFTAGGFSFAHCPSSDVSQILLGGVTALFLGIMLFLVFAMDRPMRGAVSVTPESFQSVYEQDMKWDD
jgi:hypothetical protein